MKTRSSVTVAVALLLLGASSLLSAADLVHVVKPGETLYHISRMYGVPVQSIEQLNGISNARDLRVGTVLKIPDVYVVKKGDTLFSIARENRIPLSYLLTINKIDNRHLIRIGERLIIPASASVADSSGSQSLTVTAAENSPSPPVERATPSASEPVQATPEATAAVDSSATPFWPSPGRRVFLTGKLAGGTQISGQVGEPVVSVASGRVVWVGPYRGYGRVVFVESSDGYIYVYGGNEATLVHVGEQVTSGVQLAKMGVNPHLGQACAYFFVYKNGKPVDPETAPRG